MTALTESMNWRYATKKFDVTKKVSDSDLNELLEIARLSPSSFGLQPTTVLVVTNSELRKKLRAVAWDQAQVTDASHLLVLCSRTDVNAAFVEEFVQELAKQRGAHIEALAAYKDMMLGFVKGLSSEKIIEWAKKQTYLGLGVLMLAAAEKRIDACPMEGFDPKQFDEILGLKNLTATVLCPIGYRSVDDDYAKLKKVRWSAERFVQRV